jgi:hypothetical protein
MPAKIWLAQKRKGKEIMEEARKEREEKKET